MKIMYLGLALLACPALCGMDVDVFKADPKALNAEGNSVLYRELLKHNPDLDIIGNHLSRGADPNRLNKKQQNALHILLEKGASQENCGLIAYILRGGARADEKAFQLASMNNDAQTKALLTAEADLFEAIERCDAEKALGILNLGCINLNARNAGGDTLLHRCAWVGKELADVIEWLLGNGADPKAVNAERKTILEKAKDRDRCWEVVRTNGASNQPKEESYFVEWLRKRLEKPFGELLFVEEYNENGRRGTQEVFYFSPKTVLRETQNPLALHSQVMKSIKKLT